MNVSPNDFVYIDHAVLLKIMRNAAEMGATQALAQVGKIPQYITKASAYRRFGGRRKVEGWILKGALKVCEAGIDIIEISTLAASINIASYINSESYKKIKEENLKVNHYEFDK